MLRFYALTLHAPTIFGGHKAVVRPDPIPNSAVKRSVADGSSPIGSARVGSRQIFPKSRNASFGFLLSGSGNYLSYLLPVDPTFHWGNPPARAMRAAIPEKPAANALHLAGAYGDAPSLRSLDTEVWEIFNITADAHPIHLHQVMFEVINR